MANPNGAKGYRAERAVVLWALDGWGIGGTDRITKGGGSAGTKDRADVRLGWGTPYGVVVQVKDGYNEGREPTDKMVGDWLAAVDEQVSNGGWDVGLLVHKCAGKASPNDWRWFLTGNMYAKVVLDVREPAVHPPYVQLKGYMVPTLLRSYGWLP